MSTKSCGRSEDGRHFKTAMEHNFILILLNDKLVLVHMHNLKLYILSVFSKGLIADRLLLWQICLRAFVCVRVCVRVYVCVCVCVEEIYI